jgi:hypothetical protein
MVETKYVVESGKFIIRSVRNIDINAYMRNPFKGYYIIIIDGKKTLLVYNDNTWRDS